MKREQSRRFADLSQQIDIAVRQASESYEVFYRENREKKAAQPQLAPSPQPAPWTQPPPFLLSSTRTPDYSSFGPPPAPAPPPVKILERWPPIPKCSTCGASDAIWGLPVPDCYSDEVKERWGSNPRYCEKCYPNLRDVVKKWCELSRDARNRRSRASDLKSYRGESRKQFIENAGRRFANSWFRNFDPQDPSQAEVLRQIRLWSTNADARETYPFVLLWGEPGLGKTHLAAASFKHLALGRYSPLFLNEGRLNTTWQSAHAAYDRGSRYRGPDPTDVIDEAVNAEVLILDDLGKVSLTDAWGKVIYRIIDERYVQKRPTLFTTNYAPDQLAARIAAWTADRALSGAVLKIEGRSMRGLLQAA